MSPVILFANWQIWHAWSISCKFITNFEYLSQELYTSPTGHYNSFLSHYGQFAITLFWNPHFNFQSSYVNIGVHVWVCTWICKVLKENESNHMQLVLWKLGDFETKNIALKPLQQSLLQKQQLVMYLDSQRRYCASLQLKRLQNCRLSKLKVWKKPYWCWATNFYKENLFWNILLSGFIAA